MTETGVVSSVSGRYAKVKMERKQGCKNCNLCGFGQNEKTVLLNVINGVGAKVGDVAEVEFSAVEVTKAISVIYIVPVILAGLGILITSLLNFSEIVQLVVALSMLSLSVLFIYLFEKSFKKREALPKIVRVIKEQNVD